MATTTLYTERQRERVNHWRWMDLGGVAVRYVHGSAPLVRAIWAAADSGGIIQADDMARLFPGQPTLHTATTLTRALDEVGAATEYTLDV